MKKHGAFFQALCFAYSLNHAAVASEPAKSNLDAVEQQTLYLARGLGSKHIQIVW